MIARDLRGIFIAAAGEADDDGVIFRFAAGKFHRRGDGVRAFQSRQNAFGAGEGVEGGHGVFVEAIGVADAAGVFPIAVFGADAGVVEAGGHRVDVAGLAVVVLHHVAVAAVQDAGLAVAERGGVVAGLRAAAAGFDADEGDFFVFDERIEHAGRVAAAADAGDDRVGQAAELLARLLDRFFADDRLEIADDPRERMRADDGAEDVVRRVSTLDIQSRMASLMASRSVREPLETGRTSAPSSFMLNTFGAWRRMSSSPM